MLSCLMVGEKPSIAQVIANTLSDGEFDTMGGAAASSPIHCWKVCLYMRCKNNLIIFINIDSN